MKQHLIYIGMGSNVDAASQILADAVQQLTDWVQVPVRVSTPQVTDPIDFPWPRKFTNQVACMTTDLSPKDITAALKHIEQQAGRTKAETAKGIVRLDLDLLCVDGNVLRPSDWQRPYIREGVAELQLSKRSSRPTLSSTSSASPEST